MKLFMLRLRRILALSSLITLFCLSLQGLQLKYIELPAVRSAAKIIIKQKVAEGNRIIGKINHAFVKQSKIAANLKNQLDVLQTQTFLNGYKVEKEHEEVLKARKYVAETKLKDLAIIKEAKILNIIITTQMMPIDECVVFKKPPCSIAKDMKGVNPDVACGI